jgi:uncharacterized protein (DUF924 family)
VLKFWFGDDIRDANEVAGARSALWWGGQENDQAIRERFETLHEQAIWGELREWEADPRGRLALIILIDQFSRNMHRGTPDAFAHDELSQQWCLDGLDAGVDRQLQPIERVFFYLPLEHAESLLLQERCLQLYTQLRDEAAEGERELFDNYLGYARRHHEIVSRFGRFPHRNAILGRVSTPEEVEFLKLPGSSF